MKIDIHGFYDHWLEAEYPTNTLSNEIRALNTLGKGAALLRRSVSFYGKNLLKSLYHAGDVFGYYITPGEKKIGVTFLEYIFSHHPEIDDEVFSKESIDEIKRVLVNQFHFAHDSRVSWRKLYAGNLFREFKKAQIIHRRSVRTHAGFYSYAGFKSFLPEFEYSVLINNCGTDVVPLEVREMLVGTVFIDCGAFIGDSAFVLQGFSPKYIIAMEPDSKNFAMLEKNIALNDMHTTIAFNRGAGASEGMVKFNSDGMFARADESSTYEVPITTIDAVAEMKQTKVGLIKMDIEGYELEALKGATKTIQRDKPVLLIAIYHNGRDFFEVAQYIRNIRSDYRMEIRGLNPLSPIHERFLIAY